MRHVINSMLCAVVVLAGVWHVSAPMGVCTPSCQKLMQRSCMLMQLVAVSHWTELCQVCRCACGPVCPHSRLECATGAAQAYLVWCCQALAV